MGFAGSSASFFAFQAEGSAPPRDQILSALDRGKVGSLDVSVGRSRVQGFARFDRPLSTEFDEESVFVGNLAVFSYRLDKLSLPSSTVRLHVQERAAKLLEERGGYRLRKEEMDEIREDVQRGLLARTVPSISASEVVWNIGSGRVYIFTTSLQTADDFRARFREFMGVSLRGISVLSMTEDLSPGQGMAQFEGGDAR